VENRLGQRGGVSYSWLDWHYFVYTICDTCSPGRTLRVRRVTRRSRVASRLDQKVAVDGAVISTDFRGTPIEQEARHLLQDFRADFSSLRLGRLRRGPEDSHYLIQHTRDAKSQILAATNVGQGIGSPHWWRGGGGVAYLKENKAAVQRGVLIQRIVIYSEDQRKDAFDLAAEHHTAGIQVKLALRETLRSEQRINYAIWDGQVSWEAQMNADGNPVATIYCVEAADIRRLTEIHRALWTNSIDYTP
jgi:hypothetical protein